MQERGQRREPAARATAAGDDRSRDSARRPAPGRHPTSAGDAHRRPRSRCGCATERSGASATTAGPRRDRARRRGSIGSGATDLATAGGHPSILPIGFHVALLRRTARRG